MKLSYHTVIRGKPQKLQDESGKPYYKQHNQRVNLGWGWENLEADWPTVFELITVDGLATSAELTCDNRKEDNFVSRDLVMVDIDSGMTIPELFEDSFYNKYAAGFYATPSHSDSAHRFRIMFRLEKPLTQASDVVKLNKMLMRRYTQADAACKDATRIFFGSPGCVLCERTDLVLPDSAVTQLIDQYNVWEASEMSRNSVVEHQPLDDWSRQRILDLLKITHVGEYAKWRDIGWGLKAGGFAVSDYQYVTSGMMSQKTPAMAAQVWADGKAGGRITMGTVIWFLRQRHGQDCLRREIAADRQVLDNGNTVLTNRAVLAQDRRDLAAIRRMIRND
jgi:hypothetical protein